MELNPVVFGILTVTGAGLILAVLIVTFCVMCRKYSSCRQGWLMPKSSHEANYHWLISEEVQEQILSKTVEQNDTRL